MANIFNGCLSLISIDLSNFDSENLEKMDGMFQGCSSLNISIFQNLIQKMLKVWTIYLMNVL